MPSALGRALTGLAILLLSALPARADEGNAWALKMFSETSHNFGNVARGADVTTKIKVTNIYKELVHISNVKTSCGCTAATPDKTTLQSLEAAYIEVSLDTRRFEKQKDSNVIVTFDAPLFAEVRIPISAYIRTDVVLTPGSVSFGSVEQGKGAEQTVEIAYAGRNDWQITDVKLNSPYLKHELVERSRAGGQVTYDLTMRLAPDAPVGHLNQQIMLVTDDAVPYVPVLVSARIESDVTITAPDSLGTLTPGQEKTFNVVLRGHKPFTIEKIECESDRELFRVRLSKSTRPIHVLPFTVTPPTEPGDFSEQFTVTIEGRPEPVIFSVSGKVGATSTN